jgi:hypothetical protein
MNKKLIAASLVVILFLLTTTTPVLADGAYFHEMEFDLYEPAQRALILYANSTGNCTGNSTENCAGNHTEHLILSASFEGGAEEFAWVIPVPNLPEITVSDADLFSELHAITKTQIPEGGYWFGCEYIPPPPASEGGVDIIEEKVVGPYATAILSATNATALTDWLNTNGYAFPEAGEEVISEYIEEEWYFVATKINAVEEGTGYALMEGAIEPIVLSFATNETVYPLRISSLTAANATPPEVLLYVIADRVMVPEQYPLYIGYGNWTEDAFTLEFADNVSVDDLSEYEILSQLISTYLSGDEFYLTKLRGWISADQMVDIEMVSYEQGDSLGSLAETNTNSKDIIGLTMIVGPVLGLYLWSRYRRNIIWRGPR